ncbi:hypothetical protein B2904_orf2021 [Brachyspira pilosicoli B2904]|uniref:Lipoprotein n=1 Tax=Brachyspira pilosicoli B2904 TaxID=1133568 RepID=J9UQQ6_BRAPL|nr:hypothetical protein [Brachyspira pilosicoli]AFR71350.1 hypothetical protein B2904_orf2021 [Brachyspira pilosicoli B2904]
MRKYLIIIFLLVTSCSNNSTSPDNNNNSSSVKAVTSGVYTIQYGSKTAEVNVQDKANLKTLYIGMAAGKTIYKSNDYTDISGHIDAEGNYYDEGNNAIRTKFIECAVYEYNNKKYLAVIYWDNKTGIGMQERYRLIITDENGAEEAWYGGGGDENVIPDENTSWVKYWWPFGYIKL